MKRFKFTKRFKYTLHNMVGHPLMELLYILGLESAASWVHDATLPQGWQEDYVANVGDGSNE